ncbi:MAG TPA: DinB family protein [Candidatus Solibacter sp.]|jgi:uncharacterized damage-inducible protein DinB|nr:DinB family protein [Candidatus Solibacter sp.]
MRRMVSIAALVLAAGFGVSMVSARGAGAGNNGSPNAVPSASEAVLAQWNDIGRKLIAMAEDFPEDKYEFKPVKEQRTFAAQLLHVAGSMYFFTDTAEGKKPRYADDPKRDDLKTKAQVVAFVKKGVADGAAEIKVKGDKGMSDLTTDPESKQQTPVADLAYGLIEHSGEHYGQLVVYYRVAGLVPPESRPKK